MLRRLHIERFALIDELDLDVAPGFTVITGETGAGKSIFLGALQLALGGRAEFAAVGQPGFKSVVEAEFSVAESRKAELFSEDWDWWGDGALASLVLRREVHPGGRSRAFINDSPVRLDELRRVSGSLVDIHSQRDEGLWARSEGIALLLENFAPKGVAEARQTYLRAWEVFGDAERALHELESELGSVNDPEYLRFVVQELKGLDLKAGEESQLRERARTTTSSTREWPWKNWFANCVPRGPRCWISWNPIPLRWPAPKNALRKLTAFSASTRSPRKTNSGRRPSASTKGLNSGRRGKTELPRRDPP